MNSTAMPVRHNSSKSSNKEFRYSATFDGVYDQNENGNMSFGGSTGSLNTRRDSGEDYGGYHRYRLGSDSGPHNTSMGSIDSGGPKSPAGEFVPSNRFTDRKTVKPPADPLQFIKGGGNKLAEEAQKTVVTMERQKEIKKVAQTESADWQSNLSNWKSKMRRKSAVECKKVTVYEEVEKQLLDEEESKKPKNKTFKEMMADRKGKKLAGLTSTYPMDDEDDVFKVSPRGMYHAGDADEFIKHTEYHEIDDELASFSKSVDTGLNRGSDNGVSARSNYGLTRQHTTPESSATDESKLRPLERLKTQSQSSNRSWSVIEKTIKITQNSGSNRGFGFQLKGGKETKQPIIVEKVSLGSAADVCELQVGDEIVSVNGAEVGNHYLESVDLVLSQAAKIGAVELVVKRSISQDPLLEDSFEQEEQLRLSQSQRLLAQRQPSSMSPTPEQEERHSARYEQPQRDVGLHLQDEEEERSESPSEESVDSQEARRREIDEDERERERLDALYGATFDQPQESWKNFEQKTYSSTVFDNHMQSPHTFEQNIDAQIAPESASKSQHAPPSLPTSFQPPVMHQSEDDDEDAPPPLPSAPPPAPNWNTFPGAAPPPVQSDISFFDDADTGDLLPDSVVDTPEPVLRREKRSGSIDDLDEVTQKKLETVRRRSQFLGLNVYETEEYQKIKEEAAKEKQNRMKEETALQQYKMERSDTLRPVSDILNDFREPISITTSTPEHMSQRRVELETEIGEGTIDAFGTLQSPNKDSDDTGFNSFATGESRTQSVEGLDIQEQEAEIIANLEREESKSGQSGRFNIKPQLQSSTFEMETSGMSRGLDNVHITVPISPMSPTRNQFDREAELRRMHQWQEEQDRLRKERYEREQEDLRRQHEEDMKRVREIEEEKRRQEEAILEKERAWQREMEEKKRQVEAERERIEQERVAMERQNEMQRHREEQIKRETGYQSRFPWQQGLTNEVDKDRIRREEEDILAEREREKARRETEERERQRLEAERREEERRRREEREAEMIKEKEEQLKAMEDRLAREAEQLRIDRERLQAEKEEQKRKWNLQIETNNNVKKQSAYPSASPASTLPKYTPAIGSDVVQTVTSQNVSSSVYPVHQRAQLEFVYPPRASEHSPPEKLQPDVVSRAESVPNLAQAHNNERMVSIERKEETLVARSPFGSTSSLTDPLRTRGTPQGGRKAFPIQPKPNIKTEIMSGSSTTKPSSPLNIRVNNQTYGRQAPPSPTTRVSDGSAVQLDRRSLHHLNQVPRSKLNENWVNPDAGKKTGSLRRNEAAAMASGGQHWVVEEAERRRLAEQSGKERLQKLQSRQQQQQQMSQQQQKLSGQQQEQSNTLHNTPASHSQNVPPSPTQTNHSSYNQTTSTQFSNQNPHNAGRNQSPNTSNQTISSHYSSHSSRTSPHVLQTQSPHSVTMRPTSEAEPYIAALKQAGVYAMGGSSVSGSQQSLQSLQSNRDSSPYSRLAANPNQPRMYPNGLYNEDTGYPKNYDHGTQPEIKGGYQGGTTHPRPARPIPEAVKQTLLDRVNSPKSVSRYGSGNIGPSPMSQTSLNNSMGSQPSLAQPQSLSFPRQSSTLPANYTPHSSQYPSNNHSSSFPSSRSGPSSPAYAYPHQVKNLSSPYSSTQPLASSAASHINQNQNNSRQTYGASSHGNEQTPLRTSYGGSQQNISTTHTSGAYYSNPSQSFTYGHTAPSKPPRTFESNMSPANYSHYPNQYDSNNKNQPLSPHAYPPRSPQSPPPHNYNLQHHHHQTQPFSGYYGHQPHTPTSPNDRSASDSSESAPPPVPPKSGQLLSSPERDEAVPIAEQLVSVAGHQRCAHCERELGQGAAMIIESLQLYYHVHCFRCCVCGAALGTGERGADVRVRLNKLHCQNCYSNDEAGLKYSRV